MGGQRSFAANVPARRRDPFDPIRAGERYGLLPAQSLEIWRRVSGDATDVFGGRNEDQPLTRFHALAARITLRRRRRHPDPGRVTHADARHDGGADDELAPRIPGRQTLVSIAAASLHARSASTGGASFVSRDLAGDGVAPDANNLGDIEPALLDQGAGGDPLPPAIAARMRELLRRDFTHVRVHTDAAAARAATALGARAFTLGRHIYFNRDQSGDWSTTATGSAATSAREIRTSITSSTRSARSTGPRRIRRVTGETSIRASSTTAAAPHPDPTSRRAGPGIRSPSPTISSIQPSTRSWST